ncbi:extracellular calcium-sensing receptor-like [Polypterus senegalus]|uniref:extracellular calcium-sensing receptor-like n=1 Tax=Polypterus senegalus TaxID=55291 RepID=UPI0019657EC8|nr:extracellular calcium-sensing receptor-like [Polypterus senegalus]
MIGGIFAVHFKAIPPEISFRARPQDWMCDSFDIPVFQRSQIMVFAIEEINRNKLLLPTLTLGYRIYDNCMNLQVSLRAASTLTAGLDDAMTDANCKGLPPVVAIVGEPLSTHSIAIARILGLFSIPQVSFCASCPCLSNKKEFPSFFRTVPNDAFQVKVMAKLIKHFGWTWVGVIGSDDDYGLYALGSFNEEINKFGCIAFSVTLKVNEKNNILNIVKIIKQSTAKVIVVFLTKLDVTVLMKEIVQQNITGRQWIASEAWSAFAALAGNEKFDYFGGTLGIAARRGVIPGLEEFLLQIQPSSDPENNLLKQFWETMFGCKLLYTSDTSNSSNMIDNKICTGSEDMRSKKTEFTDVSQLRASYSVYKAVYAVAYALHDLLNCQSGNGPFENNTCADIKNFKPWQLLHYLKKVTFTTHFGERVAFDENGDALAVFDIVNWQQMADGTMISKTIGVFNQLSVSQDQLILNEEDIFWNFKSGTVPESFCSKSCSPGTRKAIRKGEPICCFDCIPCADGEISSQTDSTECSRCLPDFWSNQKRNKCEPREIEFLSYEDAMGVSLTVTALLGVFISVSVLVVFIRYRNTPVVKANNSELSFLLLVSLLLCFLCSLCFIGKPSDLTCMFRHVLFGISFVLCISCILVKTIVVIMAFKAKLPGYNITKWFGISQQRGTVFFFTFIQALICIVWLTTAPPYPFKNTKHHPTKVIFECDVGSVTGFSCLLGYIGLLAGISFLLAFLARHLPDKFNEAKFITFSMLIFCAVWITFIPAYISSPGKHTVAVEIFAILASSFGLLIAIFAPKCYIILFKPEQNTKKALMGRDIPKNK